MIDQDPILLQIHDQFDDFDRYPYTDHSVISRIRFSEQSGGFKVKTYAGGIGNAYDGLVIAVREQDGSPKVAYLGRDWGGLMRISIESERLVDSVSGLTEMKGTIEGEVTSDWKVVTPDEPGFELFKKLSEQIAPIRQDLRNLLGNPSDDPEIEIRDEEALRRSNRVRYGRGQSVQLPENVRTQVSKLYHK